MELISLISKKSRFPFYKPNFSNLSGFLDEEFSDVTVTVSYGENEAQIYKLHKNVLAGSSSVLHETLRLHHTLDITFMRAVDFENLIVFMYTGQVRFESVSELCYGMHAANLYKMEDLLNKCSKQLHEKLREDPENSLLILQLDDQFNFQSWNTTFFDMVNETIQKNYSQIINCEKIQNLTKKSMEGLLQMDLVSRTSEIKVFDALLRWTKANCKNSEDPSELQIVAGDLIFKIRYNLIPYHLFTKMVMKSGLISTEFGLQVLQKSWNEDLVVPFCTTPREIIEKDETKLDAELQEWKMDSTLTYNEHLVDEDYWWTTDVVILFKNSDEDFEWISFPKAELTNTKWKVQMAKNTQFVNVRCQKLDERFRAVSVRLYVTAYNCGKWKETAGVLKCGEIISSHFLKANKLNGVQVKLHWTELDQLPRILNIGNESETCIRCQWQMHDWNKFESDTDQPCCFYSELFGPSFSQWRMVVMGKNSNYYKFKLIVRVELQYLDNSIEMLKQNAKCQLSLWQTNFGQKTKLMSLPLRFEWIVMDCSYNRQEIPNPLDLKVVIRSNIAK